MNNSDGKARLNGRNRQKLQRIEKKKVLLILRKKCSCFEIFIVVNRPYFVPYTTPYNVFKYSTVPLVTELRVTQRVKRS